VTSDTTTAFTVEVTAGGGGTQPFFAFTSFVGDGTIAGPLAGGTITIEGKTI
jgi:hypothetical protein